MAGTESWCLCCAAVAAAAFATATIYVHVFVLVHKNSGRGSNDASRATAKSRAKAEAERQTQIPCACVVEGARGGGAAEWNAQRHRECGKGGLRALCAQLVRLENTYFSMKHRHGTLSATQWRRLEGITLVRYPLNSS